MVDLSRILEVRRLRRRLEEQPFESESMDDVTLGELARRIDRLDGHLRDIRTSIVERDDLASVANSWQMLLQSQESASAARFAQMENRIANLESWQQWGVRIVIGLVITAVLGLVLVNIPGS